MRSRHVQKEGIHQTVQTSWQGWSTASGTDGEMTNLPQANLEWGKLSSLTCRYFDDVVGEDFISRQSHNELIVNPMQSVSWSLINPLMSQSSHQALYCPDGSVYDYSFSNAWSSLTYSGVTYLLGTNPPTSHDAAFGLVKRVMIATDHESRLAEAILDAENAVTVRYRTDYADMVDILLSDRDAFQMLPKILERMLALTLDFERGRLARVSDVSKLWLAYRYGIRPLLYDITTILRHLSKKGAVRRSFRSRSDTVRSEVTWNERRYGLWGNRVYDSCCTQGSSLITVNSTIRAGITADLILDVANNGLRWDRILPTIWDLTPYSFLVDWVLNVSDWLTNFAPSPRVRQQVGFVTHSCNISVQGSMYAAVAQSEFPIRVDEPNEGYYDLATDHTFTDPGYTLLGTFKSRVAFEPDVTLHFDPVSWFTATHLADLLSIMMGFQSVRTSIRRLPMFHEKHLI